MLAHRHSRTRPRRRASERGSTLVLVTILVTVLLLAGAAMLQLSGTDLDESKAYARRARLHACAKAARQVFMSQLRFSKALPTSFSFQAVDPTLPTGNPDRILLDLKEGHDPALSPAVIDDVQLVTPEQLGTGKTPLVSGRFTNDITLRSMNKASAAMVMARCRDKVGRTIEVEIQYKYGITN